MYALWATKICTANGNHQMNINPCQGWQVRFATTRQLHLTMHKWAFEAFSERSSLSKWHWCIYVTQFPQRDKLSCNCTLHFANVGLCFTFPCSIPFILILRPIWHYQHPYVRYRTIFLSNYYISVCATVCEGYVKCFGPFQCERLGKPPQGKLGTRAIPQHLVKAHFCKLVVDSTHSLPISQSLVCLCSILRT